MALGSSILYYISKNEPQFITYAVSIKVLFLYSKIEYRYKSILLSGQYSHDENSIVRFQPSISGDNKQVSTSENLNYRDNFSLVLSFPLEVTDWWEIQLNAIGNLFYIEAEYTSNTYNSSMQNLSLNSSQRFKISESITAEISGFYQTKQFWGIMEFVAFGALDFGIEKKLKRSTLRMSYSDLLGTNIWQFRTEVPSENLNSSAKINFETSIVNLTYSFRFGNDQLRKQKRKSGPPQTSTTRNFLGLISQKLGTSSFTIFALSYKNSTHCRCTVTTKNLAFQTR